MRFWCLVVVVVSFVACKRESDEWLAVLDAKAQNEIAARASRAVDDPKVSAQLERCLETMSADPGVEKQGTQLGEQLMANPIIGASIGRLMERLTEDPQVMAAVMELTKQHPGASQDEIGELFGKQFEQRWDTPEVGAEWTAAWNGMLDKLGTSPEMAKLSQRVMNKVIPGIETPERARKFNKRLTELNGGSAPNTALASQLYLDHAWAEPRIREVAAKLIGSPTFCKTNATFVSGVLAVDVVTNELRDALVELADSPAIQKHLLRTMQLIYAKDLDLPALGISMRALFSDPTLVRSLSEVLDATAQSPRVVALANQWFDTVRRDPQIAAAVTTFLDAW